LPSNYDSDAHGLPVPDADEKKAEKFPFDAEFLPSKVRISEPLIRPTGCGDNGADAGGGTSGAHCTGGLAARNSMNTDSPHTDSNERTDARSTRRDNNSGTSENRSIRWETQN